MEPPPPGKIQRGPYVVRCEPGKHAYCRCKQSRSFPLCDGTHRGSEFTPIKVILEHPVLVSWCACSESKNLPFCDGTHARLDIGPGARPS